jgi:hypothetical protein
MVFVKKMLFRGITQHTLSDTPHLKEGGLHLTDPRRCESSYATAPTANGQLANLPAAGAWSFSHDFVSSATLMSGYSDSLAHVPDSVPCCNPTMCVVLTVSQCDRANTLECDWSRPPSYTIQ